MVLIKLLKLDLCSHAHLRGHEVGLRYLDLDRLDLIGQRIRLSPEHLAEVGNLFVWRFAGDARGELARDHLLQYQAVDARGDGQAENQPEDLLQGASQAKTTVAEDRHDAQQAQPDMALEPGLAGPDPPPRRYLPQRRQQARVDHERRAQDTI